MQVFGFSPLLLTGIVNFILIFFQVASGRRWINVPLRLHRWTGMVLLVTATVHGGLALLV